jgi:hypothetical protein
MLPLVKIKYDKLELLKVIFEFINDWQQYSEVNVELESEVAEVLTEMKNKKKRNLLKAVHEELGKWINSWNDQA